MNEKNRLRRAKTNKNKKYAGVRTRRIRNGGGGKPSFPLTRVRLRERVGPKKDSNEGMKSSLGKRKKRDQPHNEEKKGSFKAETEFSTGGKKGVTCMKSIRVSWKKRPLLY